MKTPITYYGGKQQLAKTIINMMPAHRIYCEPFFGGGAVFFTKPSTFLEVINDKNDLLITFISNVLITLKSFSIGYNIRFALSQNMKKLAKFTTTQNIEEKSISLGLYG